jgi:hypothetical protein
VVQPDGRVVVPINGFTATGFTVLSFVSTDGGASWGNTVLVTTVQYHRPAGNVRASIPLPSGETDRSGKVYLAWPDCRFESGCTANDLVLSTTTDGLNWSPVERIPADTVGSGVDHFIVGLGVDPASNGATAHLGLAYNFYPNAACTTDTCQLEVGFVSSIDGGTTWTTATQLAGPMNLTWAPLTTQGYMVGDYISTSIVAGAANATPVFEMAGPPSGSTLDLPTYAASVPLGGTTTAAQAGSRVGTAPARSGGIPRTF